jgi:hypothetical protein
MVHHSPRGVASAGAAIFQPLSSCHSEVGGALVGRW